MPWTKAHIDNKNVAEELAAQGLRALTYRDALREAQEEILRRDPQALLLGEGVDDPGGIFGSTLGLANQFGKERVMDIPIAENGMTGVAIGAAMTGLRPIFIHMRMDFLPMCMDQLVNHAAKWRYMTGGRVGVPLTIRSIIGRGWGSAAQHSQALHGLFLHIPGLRVFMPGTPYDAKGLLLAAHELDDPVMFIEHRWLYDRIGYVPEGWYTVSPGEAVIRRPGRDITVVALSQMVYEAAQAAETLAAEGIELEVLDPRTLAPLDDERLLDSVRRTGRLLVADVACKTGGAGAEIVCRVAEAPGVQLRCPARRINFADAPTPCSPALEELYYPSAATIAAAAREMMAD